MPEPLKPAIRPSATTAPPSARAYCMALPFHHHWRNNCAATPVAIEYSPWSRPCAGRSRPATGWATAPWGTPSTCRGERRVRSPCLCSATPVLKQYNIPVCKETKQNSLFIRTAFIDKYIQMYITVYIDYLDHQSFSYISSSLLTMTNN